MDFRQYDPGIGRFYGLDLLAEATPWATPNHFALNNPVIASDPTGLLAASPWNDLIAFMNEFATGGGGGGAYASMTYTSNTSSGGGNAWGFDVSYNNGNGASTSLGSIYGSGFSVNNYMQGTGGTAYVNLPELNVRGLSTREGGLAIQNHVYKYSPYYQNFYGCDVRIVPDVGAGSYAASAINVSQGMWNRFNDKGLDSPEGRFMMHEYGHYLQNKEMGSILYNLVVVPQSLISNLTSSVKKHSQFWTEVQASTYAFYYFGFPDKFEAENNPTNPFSISEQAGSELYNQYLNYENPFLYYNIDPLKR